MSTNCRTGTCLGKGVNKLDSIELKDLIYPGDPNCFRGDIVGPLSGHADRSVKS